jgi:hypothetical protein
MERLNLSPTPIAEDCAQVGSDNYYQQSKIETTVFKQQLYRMLEAEFDEVKVTLLTVGHPHDFGTYKDVEISYNENDEASCDQAFWLESNLPEYWDEEAKQMLKELNYEVKVA